eukprot:TRINITY_DN85_c0_g1_i3.p9 TRINITY_DN85_c0_g1~~TRINITY_DN85_c0_g1_i3.p9  ORF type:complete len:261 (-),score=26.14 TRINITY_DN85_c0_g1_i3:2064-2846(-)
MQSGQVWRFYKAAQLVILRGYLNSRMCGKAVCGDCSTTTKRISATDPTLYRICDDCDDKVSNFEIEQGLKEVLVTKTSKVHENKVKIEEAMEKIAEYQRQMELLNKKMAKLDEEYKEAEERENREQAELEEEIENTKITKQETSETIRRNKKLIADLDKALISDREKYMKVENRYKKKQAAFKKVEEEFRKYEKQLNEQKGKLESSVSLSSQLYYVQKNMTLLLFIQFSQCIHQYRKGKMYANSGEYLQQNEPFIDILIF